MAIQCPRSSNAYLCDHFCTSYCKRSPGGREVERRKEELKSSEASYLKSMAEWIGLGAAGCPDCRVLIENSAQARRLHAEWHANEKFNRSVSLRGVPEHDRIRW